MRSLWIALCLSAGFAGPAWALGTLVAPDGSTVPMNAARTLFVRGPDSVQIITQVNYSGNPAKLLWILGVPNFNNPADEGVLVTTLGQEAFDELDRLTTPRLDGACDGAPNGQGAFAPQRDGWGPAANMALPVRSFPIPEIEMGRLGQHAAEFGVMIDEPAQAAIDALIDQNFMVVAARIDTAAIGVNRVDPIISIRYPLAPGEQIRVPVFPTNAVVPPSGAVDFVWWTLGSQRMRSSLPTEELDFTAVKFVTNAETDYVPALDAALALRQTQIFMREFAGPVDGFDDAGLEGVRGGAGFLTRLRGRLTGPALRASRMATPTLRDDGTSAYSNVHTVAGFMCGGPMVPDQGVAADMGGEQPDMAVVDDDLGVTRPDGGTDGGVTSDGGGGGGCHSTPGVPAGLGWLALLGLPLLRRRAHTASARKAADSH